MSYITRADIEGIYGANFLAVLVPDGVSIDNAVALAGEIASSEADLYLCKSYAVPLAMVPAALKAAIIDLACYRLAVTHDRLTEEITERSKRALALLKDIASDKAGLGTAEPPAVSPAVSTGENGAASSDGAYFSARRRHFGGLP